MIEQKILTQKFTEFFGSGSEPEIFFSPGRVNIIGEHLDYNGGAVFPAAIGLGITGVIRRNTSGNMRMRSMNFTDEYTVDLSGDIKKSPLTKWGNYPAGVAKYLQKSGSKLSGCDILFGSDLPDGAGLSSSACIEVLTAIMLDENRAKDEASRVETAKLCRAVENEFIGVNCGIMDQFAIAMGRIDHAVYLNASTLEYRYVPFKLKGCSLVIMNSNKPRKLSESKFNERQAECAAALETIRRSKNINHLADADPADLDLITDPAIKKRARHVITEQRRVLESIPLLENNRLIEFGKMMTASHNSLRDDYEVTGRELDSLVNASLSSPGCIGARMTGAGFGGCCIALVDDSDYLKFITRVSEKYTAETGLTADYYPTVVSAGAGKI